MKLKVLSILTLAIIMLVSCSKDEGKNDLDSEYGEERVVTLTIYDGTVNSRAAGGNTDPPTTTESTIDVASGVKVIVFNENGTLEFPTSGNPVLSLTSIGANTYQTAEFKVTTGQKYFYVFANDASNEVGAINSGMTRSSFINKILNTSLDASDNLNLTTSNFLMGTLWNEKKEAPSDGVPGAPKPVSLTIGRLVSKVTLNGVSKGTSTIRGTFSDPHYRLGTIPKKIFIVGHNNESLDPPPLANHGVVTSAVHTAPRYTTMPDENYLDYTNTWKLVDAAPDSESFYTVENTTAPDNDGIQYYGNTSFIQIRTVYTPHIDEVCKVDDLTPKGTFSGPTFYTANLLSTGERLLFEDDPRTAAGLNPHADIDQNSILVYSNGLNYHEFPIHDPEDGLPSVQRNAVLRNHSYIYTVTSIADLGSPGDIVPPEKPVPTTTTLDIEVQVVPWSKIENTDVPI